MFAQVPWDGILNASGLALLGLFMTYLLTKFLPTLIEVFRKELEAQRSSAESTYKSLEETHVRTSQELVSTVKDLADEQRRFGEILIKKVNGNHGK